MFVDREDQLGALSGELQLLRASPQHFKLIEVIGLGGVGKTRLLHHLNEAVKAQKNAPSLLWVSLEAEAASGEIGPLIVLREQLGIQCLLFDAALVRYWGATGQPLQLKSSQIGDSLVFKAADALRAASKVTPLTLAFALDVWLAGRKKLTETLNYTEAEFEAIDDLKHDPGALRERLPHYLARDVRARQDRRLVVFYDAYDRQSAPTVAEQSPWLREFVGTLERGLHLIATREPLGWPADWNGVSVSWPVDELPEAAARALIRERIPAIELEVEDRLLAASRRIPFFLEAALLAYETHLRDADGAVKFDELPASQHGAVAYLLAHLSPARRLAAVASATGQFFDRELFDQLVRQLNIPIALNEFQWFSEAFFTEQINVGESDAASIEKTHDLLADFVREADQLADQRRAALIVSVRHLLGRCRTSPKGPGPIEVALVQGMLVGWQSLPEMSIADVEAVMDVCYLLHDAGYWRELSGIARASGDPDHPVRVVSDFFSALALRRDRGVTAALDALVGVESRADALGRHRQSLDLEVAYISEIGGNYGRARTEFRALYERFPALNPADRTQLRSWLYHADMLTMDGQFIEASRVLLEAAEVVGREDAVQWAELVRHRAHTFRFSCLFDEAEGLYLSAIEASRGAPGMLGKLTTNLAESRCWHQPEQALSDAYDAVDLNSRIGNHLELAKCEAARSIAYARLSKFDQALEAADEAIRLAEAVGYPAGVAFALQARSIAEHLGGHNAGVSSLDRLAEAVRSLGTYSHLTVAPLRLSRHTVESGEAIAAVSWIEPAGFEARLDRVLGR